MRSCRYIALLLNANQEPFGIHGKIEFVKRVHLVFYLSGQAPCRCMSRKASSQPIIM